MGTIGLNNRDEFAQATTSRKVQMKLLDDIKEKGEELARKEREKERRKAEREQKKRSRSRKIATIEEVRMLNLNEKVIYRKSKSDMSRYVKDIIGFTYGPFCSRFWLFRKHICSMRMVDLKAGLPFYAWQCLTIMFKDNKQMNLVIKDEDSMQLVIRYLLLHLQSMDGTKNTAQLFLQHYIEKKFVYE